VSWVSPEQATALLAVLNGDLGSEVGYDLVRVLRQRVAAELARAPDRGGGE
jgi:hypothetical protein